MNKVNIINNAEEDLNVIINSVDGGIQVIIEKKMDVNLLSLKVGDIFNMDNVEYIVLEQLEGNQTAIIRKEVLEESMKFDSDNNNWKTSSIRRYLNDEYLREIENVFGRERIIEHIVDLLSLDGLDDYGVSTDKVSFLTIDQYRKYRKALNGNLENCWWLITPDSTASGNSTSYVQFVDSGGGVGCDHCGCGVGVRPFFIVQS